AELDEPVDGLGAAVARAVGVEVGQERCPPAAQSLPEPGDLWDRAGRQRSDQLLGEAASLGGCGLVEDVAEVLGAVVGDLDRDMLGMRRDRAGQPSLLARGDRESVVWERVSGPCYTMEASARSRM